MKGDFADRLCKFTETLLTARLKRKLKERMKQQRRNPVLDWVLAILWAAGVVLLINQYLFQNYRIPSESMEKTLLIGDMIFVDKLSFGPELLPGVGKLQGSAQPARGQIIVFENPTYISRGPVFTILQQALYMLTLTLVDIDRDQNGEQRVHYLIKRMIGAPGDRLRIDRGEVSIKPEGSPAWMAEPALMESLGLPYKRVRSFADSEYTAIQTAGLSAAYKEKGIPLTAAMASNDNSAAYKDMFGYDAARTAGLRDIDPADTRIAATARRYELGWYIPQGRVFPMGDNRDNSRDGRYFGPVSQKRVLGRALFIYWPLGRAGGIK